MVQLAHPMTNTSFVSYFKEVKSVAVWSVKRNFKIFYKTIWNTDSLTFISTVYELLQWYEQIIEK